MFEGLSNATEGKYFLIKWLKLAIKNIKSECGQQKNPLTFLGRNVCSETHLDHRWRQKLKVRHNVTLVHMWAMTSWTNLFRLPEFMRFNTNIYHKPSRWIFPLMDVFIYVQTASGFSVVPHRCYCFLFFTDLWDWFHSTDYTIKLISMF